MYGGVCVFIISEHILCSRQCVHDCTCKQFFADSIVYTINTAVFSIYASVGIVMIESLRITTNVLLKCGSWEEISRWTVMNSGVVPIPVCHPETHCYINFFIFVPQQVSVLSPLLFSHTTNFTTVSLKATS